MDKNVARILKARKIKSTRRAMREINKMSEGLPKEKGLDILNYELAKLRKK